ncbi:MAG: hypothetical protein ABSA33_00345 [Candidatus Micrarchaeaceae archaeon]
MVNINKRVLTTTALAGALLVSGCSNKDNDSALLRGQHAASQNTEVPCTYNQPENLLFTVPVVSYHVRKGDKLNRLLTSELKDTGFVYGPAALGISDNNNRLVFRTSSLDSSASVSLADLYTTLNPRLALHTNLYGFGPMQMYTGLQAGSYVNLPDFSKDMKISGQNTKKSGSMNVYLTSIISNGLKSCDQGFYPAGWVFGQIRLEYVK